MQIYREFVKGIWKENPIFRLALGLCPTLAVSTSIENAIGMGAATTFVLVSSNTIVSLLIWILGHLLSEEGMKSINKIRIPIFIVVIASFVTIVEMVMAAYFPELSESLGIFIPLIVVNCIILGRAEGFASKNPVPAAIVDGLGMGIGFTIALLLISTVRGALGSGALLGVNLFGQSFQPVLLFILPPGAFIVIGLYMGLFNWLESRKKSS